jgi:hypothetical protein
MKDVSVVLTGGKRHIEVDTDAALLITIDHNPDGESSTSNVTLVGCADSVDFIRHLVISTLKVLGEIDRLDPELAPAIMEAYDDIGDPRAPKTVYDLFLHGFVIGLKERGYV